MTKDDVSSLFLLVGSLWPTSKMAKPTKEMVRAWYLALEPYPWDEVKRGTVAYARESKFPPDLADVTSFCPDMTRKLDETRREERREAQMARDLERVRKLLGTAGKEAVG